MTEVEIDGKTYCAETLIHTVERLTNEVKASVEYHKTALDTLRAEINQQYNNIRPYNIKCAEGLEMALRIIDEYRWYKEENKEIEEYGRNNIST